MQIDTEFIGAVSGIVSSIITSAIGYGILKAKVERLEHDLDEASKKFVSNDLFQATILHLKEDLHEIKNDVRELLKLQTQK